MVLLSQLNGWISGYYDAADKSDIPAWIINGNGTSIDPFYVYLCTDRKAKKKLLGYINFITDSNYLRKEIFNDIFKKHGFHYNIYNNDIEKIN